MEIFYDQSIVCRSRWGAAIWSDVTLEQATLLSIKSIAHWVGDLVEISFGTVLWCVVEQLA